MFEAVLQCPFCYQSFTLSVDPSEGPQQSLDIDCEICCHALMVHVEVDEESHRATAAAEKAF